MTNQDITTNQEFVGFLIHQQLGISSRSTSTLTKGRPPALFLPKISQNKLSSVNLNVWIRSPYLDFSDLPDHMADRSGGTVHQHRLTGL